MIHVLTILRVHLSDADENERKLDACTRYDEKNSGRELSTTTSGGEYSLSASDESTSL
jgi:hypothetical protein